MTIQIAGYTTSDKVPGYVGETKYGRGKTSIGAISLKCLVVGSMLSTGSATADTDLVSIFTTDEADTQFGAASEIAMMCYAALSVPGVTLVAAPLADPTGVQAQVTVQVTGTWTTSGTVRLFLDGIPIDVSVASTDVVGDVATSINAAVNQKNTPLFPTLPFASTVATDTATVKCRNKGLRGNTHVIDTDLSLAPAGLGLVVTGGSALTDGIIPFVSGTGSDDVTNVLALLTTDVYDYPAFAQADSSNLALIKAQVASEAGPLVGHMEHYTVASARALSTATSLASTTLNDQRGAVVWGLNVETHPSVIAAEMAAHRSVSDGDNPNGFWSNKDITWAGKLNCVAPQRYKADIAKRATLKAALDSGVTPLMTAPDGTVSISRGIVTHCLNGAAPDYRTLDWADAVVPDRIRKELGAQYELEQQSNPYAGPDPASNERPAPEGVLTPTLWNASATKVLKDAETANWIEAVDSNLPVSEWDAAAKRIMSAVPVVVRSKNYALGASVRQTAA
jgi:phage tail sheath gpL-like